MRGTNEGESMSALRPERATGGILVIHNQDVQDVEVPLLQHAGDGWIALQDVRVCVNGMKSG